MITLFIPENKFFLQSDYKKLIDATPLHQLQCTCGIHGCLSRHGFYERSLKSEYNTAVLRVLRVKCSSCGKTHALLPSCCVPFSQMSLACQIKIIMCRTAGSFPQYLCHHNPDITERDIFYVFKQFNHYWKQRLLSFSIVISIESTFIHSCFHYCHLQFMQIRCITNILFLFST